MFRDLSFLDEEKICPHCKTTMSCCEAPPIHVGDGLGWGSEVMFICLNDFCPLFIKGWDHIESRYGHHASYRYMELPKSREGNCMMVGNADAFKACVIDKEALRTQNERYYQQKEAQEALKTCIERHDLKPVLTLLLDDAVAKDDRLVALEYLEKLNDLSCIDPLRNHKFRDPNFASSVKQSLAKILKANYKKECPHCMEIIKMQAVKCMFCKENL